MFKMIVRSPVLA